MGFVIKFCYQLTCICRCNFSTQEHRLLAREAVRKSLVLLKNGKDPKIPFFPLNKDAKRILVAGTHADDIGYQCGGWTITWYGGSGRTTIGMFVFYRIISDRIIFLYNVFSSMLFHSNSMFLFACKLFTLTSTAFLYDMHKFL